MHRGDGTYDYTLNVSWESQADTSRRSVSVEMHNGRRSNRFIPSSSPSRSATIGAKLHLSTRPTRHTWPMSALAVIAVAKIHLILLCAVQMGQFEKSFFRIQKIAPHTIRSHHRHNELYYMQGSDVSCLAVVCQLLYGSTATASVFEHWYKR